jgi:uncharacterized membrane-anchored protein
MFEFLRRKRAVLAWLLGLILVGTLAVRSILQLASGKILYFNHYGQPVGPIGSLLLIATLAVLSPWILRHYLKQRNPGKSNKP